VAKIELFLPAKRRRPGHPFSKVVPVKKVSIEVTEPKSLEEALGNLLFLDARDLDRQTRKELLRVLPQLFQASRAWKARFAELGCLSCHRKKVPYGAGGLCDACHVRELHRMKAWYRKIGGDSKTLAEFKEALTLKYNTAQRLLGGEE